MDVESKKEMFPIGNYYVSTTKNLRYELSAKIPGLNIRNVDYVIYKLLGKQPRTLTLSELPQSDRKKLEDIVTAGVIDNVKNVYANKKKRTLTKNYSMETSSLSDSDTIFLGNKVRSETELDKKRLIRMNCYVGSRLNSNLKVHGQKTRSTGRKNKVLKGFQKNKKTVKDKEEPKKKDPKLVKPKPKSR